MANVTRYQIEETAKPKAKCMACKQVIDSGELRMGIETIVAGTNRKSTKWRHWKCVGSRVLSNAGELSNVHGMEKLSKVNQELVHKAFANKEAGKKSGSGAKASGDKPKRKRSKPKKEEEDSEEEEEIGEEPNSGAEEDDEAAAEDDAAAEEAEEVPAAAEEAAADSEEAVGEEAEEEVPEAKRQKENSESE